MLNYYLNKMGENLIQCYTNSLEELISNIQKETGFSRECAIKYINYFLDLEFKLRYENDNRMFLDLIPKWKPIEEILESSFDEKCEEEILIKHNWGN